MYNYNSNYFGVKSYQLICCLSNPKLNKLLDLEDLNTPVFSAAALWVWFDRTEDARGEVTKVCVNQLHSIWRIYILVPEK